VSKTIVITVNSAWNLANFRSGLIKSFIAAGYHVIALAPEDRYVDNIIKLGCEFHPLPMDNQGTNPLRDLKLLANYYQILRKIRPIALLGFTIKPNVYGSIAAHFLGIPVINNIAGLGTTFIQTGWLNKVARLLYKLALSRSRLVFFQNRDDMNLFIKTGLVKEINSALLPGSGVDTSHFSPRTKTQPNNGPTKFLLIARLLWDKGVGEYVEASRLLQADGVNVDIQLLGFLDVKNPSAISREQLNSWQSEGLVSYLGESDDVRPYLADADCIVLPSYREGTPRSLLEACSMGKPIITTDAPGCRDLLLPEKNGYLVPIKDAEALADAIKQMASLDADEREHMGAESRNFILKNYDESIVIDSYLSSIKDISKPQH
jgi:glycosyltransferase involved in cell wall biosynthesis